MFQSTRKAKKNGLFRRQSFINEATRGEGVHPSANVRGKGQKC